MFKCLLKNNADPNVLVSKTSNYYSLYSNKSININNIQSPVFATIAENLPEYLIELIKYGANLYEKNDNGQTAFDFAEQLKRYCCSIILNKHRRYAIIDGKYELWDNPDEILFDIDEISIFDAILSDSESYVKAYFYMESI